MLEALITSKTRVKLLLKLFLNANSSSYLRSLESEFGESTNAIRLELNRFESAGLIESYAEGNRKYYKANQKHPLFSDINSILMKMVGLDKIIDNVVMKLGHLDRVFLTGEFARGRDSDIIDLIFVGEDIDRPYLMRKIEQVEELIARRVRYIVYNPVEFEQSLSRLDKDGMLLLWKKEEKE